MRRKIAPLRIVIILILAIGLSVPVAEAVSPLPPLVAVILPRENDRFMAIHQAFLRNFEKYSPSTGKPRIYLQSPSADVMSLRNSIRKATALGADLTIVYGTRAASAAKLEDFTEPLLFADVFDPVAMGLVPSADRGAPLITGVCGQAPLQTLLKILQETMGTIRLGVPVEPKFPACKLQAQVLQRVACHQSNLVGNSRGKNDARDLCWLEIVTTSMQRPSDMVRALNDVREKIEAIYMSDLMPSDLYMQATLDYAAQAGLPVISQVYGTADLGAMITLESDPEEQGEMLSEIAIRVIEGELPEDIPPTVPRRVSLIVNLKVAKKLGIDVPFKILLQTTRVIR